MPTYATITGRITFPGSETGVPCLVTATPRTRSAGISLPDRLVYGVVAKPTGTDGTLPTGAAALRIPVDPTDPDLVIWHVAVEPLDPLLRGGPAGTGLPAWVLYDGPITGDTTLMELADTDPTALAAEFPASVLQQALDARDVALAAAAAAESVADDPEVLAAAVALAQSDVGLVHRTDPGVARVVDYGPAADATYGRAMLDAQNKLRVGFRNDGYTEIPLLQATKSKIAGTTREVTSRWGGYLWVLVDQNNKILDGILANGQRIGGTTSTDPATWPMRIVLNFGQSNASTADPLPAEVVDTLDDPRIFRLSDDGTSIVQGAGRNTAMAEVARREVPKLAPRTSLLIVDCAYGGSGFSTTSLDPPPSGYHVPGDGGTAINGGTWDRTLTADPLNRALQTVARLLSALALAPAGSALWWAFWCQGEADRSYMTPTAYKAALTDLFGYIRSAVPGAATMPIVIGSMTPETIASGASSADMDANHIDLPRTVQRTAYTRGPAGMTEFTSGVIHYSSHGNRARYAGIMEALDRARRNVATIDPSQPRNIKTTRRADGQVTITWDATPGRSTAYLLRYRVGLAGAQVDATLTAPLAQSFTLPATVAATDPVGVQMAGTNEVGTSVYTMEVLT